MRIGRWPCDRTICASPHLIPHVVQEMQRENAELVPPSCRNNMYLGPSSSKIIVNNSSKTSGNTSLFTLNAFESKGRPNGLFYLGRAQTTSNLVLSLVLSVTSGGLLLPQIPTVCRLIYLDTWKAVCHRTSGRKIVSCIQGFKLVSQ
jgi:hypothetical protein